MSGNNVQIENKGIIRNVTDENAIDGAMNQCHNMRFINGSWKAVSDKLYANMRHSMGSLSLPFRHDILPDNYFVHYDNDNGNIVIADYTSDIAIIIYKWGGTGLSTRDGVPATNENGKFIEFAQIGNMLVCMTTNKTIYLYYQDGEYVDISETPTPFIQYADGTRSGFLFSIGEHEFDDMNEMCKFINGMYARNISQNKDKNLIRGISVIRTAWQLFDCTYIYATAPQLAMFAYTIPYIDNSLAQNENLYDDSYLKFTNKILHRYKYVKIVQPTARVDFSSYINPNSELDPQLKKMIKTGVIKSLVFFATPLVDYIDTTAHSDLWKSTYINGVSQDYLKVTAPINISEMKNILSNPLFFRVGEYNLSKLLEEKDTVNGKTYSRNIVDTVILDFSYDIRTAEMLPISSTVASKHIANGSYTYNDRLHMFDVKEEFIGAISNVQAYRVLKHIENNGFRYTNDADTLVLSRTEKLPSNYKDNMLYLLTGDSEQINNAKIRQAKEPSDIKLYVQVELSIDGKSHVISVPFTRDYKPDDETQPLYKAKYNYLHNITFDYDNSYLYIILNPLITYPDHRASKLTFYYKYNNINYILEEFALKPCISGNFAYYINEFNAERKGFVPIRIEIPYNLGQGRVAKQDTNGIVRNSNRIRISATGNAMYFDVKDEVVVGNRDAQVIRVIANSYLITDKAFGQAPLMTFTDKGVYAMLTGTEVAYTAVHPMSTNALVGKHAVISTEAGIVYATKRNLFVVQGQEHKEVSEMLKGRPRQTSFDFSTAGSLVKKAVSDNIDFADRLNDNLVLAYDEKENELLLINTIINGNEYNTFVLNIGTWQAHTRSDTFTNTLRYKGKTLLISTLDGRYSLYYFNEHTNMLCDSIFLETQAQTLQSKHAKNIIKGLLIAETKGKLSMQILGSNDLKEWEKVFVSNSDYATTDVTIPRLYANYKYYRFGVYADGYTTFEGITINYKTRFTKTYR